MERYLDNEEIIQRVKSLEELERDLFWGKIIENQEEV
jgi:hypothetical protein